MGQSSLSLMAAAPEIYLLCLIGVVLMVDLFSPEHWRAAGHRLAIAGLVGAVFVQLYVGAEAPEQTAFGGMFVNDALAQTAKLFMYAVTILCLGYSREYAKNRGYFNGEHNALTLFALLGMNVMSSSGNFVALFVGLEMLSLALYAMIALRRDSPSSAEAALKYFILGSLSSGILLYGLSMIYGATGSLDAEGVFKAFASGGSRNILASLGLIFVVVGVTFKFGAAPFHMWVPDVYEGAGSTVAAFVGSAPKIATMVFGFRIFMEGMQHSIADWQELIAIVAVVSLFIGNLAAIAQTNFKRMLGYSTVSHMGFVLLGFVGNGTGTGSMSMDGMTAALYYSVTYALMSLVAFGVIIALTSKEREIENIEDLAGLNRTHPWYAFMMFLAMFSMAGIPPLMGFYAKAYVLVGLLNEHMYFLAVYGMIMALIGAFYYLRVVKVMYMDRPTEAALAVEPHFAPAAKALLAVNALALLAFGVAPAFVMDLCAQALSGF